MEPPRMYRILRLWITIIWDTEHSFFFFFFCLFWLAYALGSLNNLEELILPTGDGIHQMAKLIVQQCQHLQCLQVLQFFQTLDDDSVVEIGELPSDKLSSQENQWYYSSFLLQNIFKNIFLSKNVQPISHFLIFSIIMFPLMFCGFLVYSGQIWE